MAAAVDQDDGNAECKEQAATGRKPKKTGRTMVQFREQRRCGVTWRGATTTPPSSDGAGT
eukprot:2257156-Amphidinium_carterae.3